MKTIEQNAFETICIDSDENKLVLDDGFGQISIEKQGAAELIKVLQEWVNEMA